MTTDLLDTSAATWSDHTTDPPAVDPRLRVPTEAPVRERLAAWRLRHHLRREEADRVYLGSRHPERGWPVAGDRAVLDFFKELIRERRGIFVSLVVLNALAAAAGLVVPALLGDLIDRTVDQDGAGLDTLAWLVVGVVVTQAVLTFFAQRTSTVFGQDLLASAREYVVRVILRLPLGQVESASTGDLVTRVTRDVGTMSRSVQYGVPMAIISLLTVSLSVVAMLLNSVLLAVPSLLVIGTSYYAVRSYLRRAPRGYITEGATYSRINTTLTETVEGARTVEALGLSGRRVGQGDDDIAVSAQAERYTMSLRNLLFAVIDIAFNTPRVVTLVVGAWGYAQGWLSLGQITTAVLYVEALSGPLDRLVGELDRLQVGATSTARLLGIAEVPPDREPTDGRPDGPRLVGHDLRFAYREDHDVLHGIDLELRTGERLAIVGPSGSGKSTLGPAAVRHQPAAHRHRHRRRRRAGRPAAGGAAHRGRAGHPGAPRLHRLGPRQHRARARGLPRRGGLGGAVGRRVARLGGAAAARPRHPDRLRPARADPGPGAAGRAGAADHRRPAHAGARRGDLADRPAHRALPRGLDERAARRPYRRGDRPPAPHRPRRRPDRGRHRRQDRRARQPPRAGRPGGRPVRRAVAGLDQLTRSPEVEVRGPPGLAGG